MQHNKPSLFNKKFVTNIVLNIAFRINLEKATKCNGLTTCLTFS